MLRYLILVAAVLQVKARVDMIQSDMETLKKHPMKAENVTADELQWIITEEWMKLINDDCSNLDPGARINAAFDYTLVGTTTLAWASYTALLIDGVWIPSIATLEYSGYDFMIGVNPEPPNGWHISDKCDDISYRYDLRTVIRHEMLHGLGIGSSITKNGVWRVGYNFEGNCYPTRYDTLIEDQYGNKMVNGCQIQPLDGKRLYINGVRLFHPSTYSQGSSLSHHTYTDKLMFWRLPAMKCIDIEEPEFKMLAALSVQCSGVYYSPAYRLRPSLFVVLITLFLSCIL